MCLIGLKPHFIIRLSLLFRDRRNELEGEIFEMLSTFTDFVAFKEMFLDYKSVSTKIPEMSVYFSFELQHALHCYRDKYMSRDRAILVQLLSQVYASLETALLSLLIQTSDFWGLLYADISVIFFRAIQFSLKCNHIIPNNSDGVIQCFCYASRFLSQDWSFYYASGFLLFFLDDTHLLHVHIPY